MGQTTQESAATAAPVPGESLLGALRLFRRGEVVEILGRAYGDAAGRGADMRAATDIFEQVREALLAEGDPFALWILLDNQVGRAEVERLLPVVRQLRDECARILTDRLIDRVDEAFHRDPETGWAIWVWAYVGALQDWRDTFCTALANAPLLAPREYTEKLDAMRRCSALLAHERWAECRDGFAMLSEQPAVDDRRRAWLMGLLAQIHLAVFDDVEGAEEWLHKAGDTSSLAVLIGWTRYWLQKRDSAKAADFARRAIALDPRRQDGYMALGECDETEENLERAEGHYQDAISAASGSSAAYLRLIQLYGRKVLFAQRRERISSLIAKVRAVDPSAEYNLLLTEAANNLQNELDREALAGYSRAIEKDPTRLRGYVNLGNAHLTLADQPGRTEKALFEARIAFGQAIQVAPEAYEGYWFMAVVCERAGQWKDGLEHCTTALRLQPRLEGRFRSKKADFLRKLGLLREAEDEVARALAADRTGGEPVQAMMALADVYYQEKGDREAALRLYRLARDARGEPFDPEYDNLIGNLHFYFKEYDKAAEAYRNALTKAPKNAVIHSNLVGALERMPSTDRFRQYDEIIDALRQAVRNMPGNAEFSGKLARFEQRRRFLLHYGEPALDLIPTVTPIQPILESRLLGFVLTEARDALRDAILQRVAAMRAQFRERYGLIIPGVSFTDVTQGSSPPGSYYLMVMGELKEEGRIPPDRMFVLADPAEATDLTGEPPDLAPPGSPPPGLWLDESQAARAREKGLSLSGPADFLLDRLQAVLEDNLADLIHYETTVALLNQPTTGPRNEILKQPETAVALTRILKGLLVRRISIGDLDAILVACDSMWRRGKNEDTIVKELARRHQN